MPRKAKLDAQGLREKRFWPHLSAEHQAELVNFLGWYRAVAQDAKAGADAIAAIASQDLGSRGNAEWWAYVIRSIDWLLSRVPTRQQYLEILLAEQEGRWQPKATRPGT